MQSDQEVDKGCMHNNPRPSEIGVEAEHTRVLDKDRELGSN